MAQHRTLPDWKLERREFPRVKVLVPFELREAHGYSFTAARNLSAGGAFLGAVPLARGTRLALAFVLPGDPNRIVCEGEVVNVPDPTQLGVGLHFTVLSDVDRERVAAFARRSLDR